MRQYAWYSPELDVIVLQTIRDGWCRTTFEWYWYDLADVRVMGSLEDPMQRYLWLPLGEL